MKAITIHQPWASLIILGFKELETRGWDTNYRGEIAIHAGKKIIPFNEIFGELSIAQQKTIMDKICREYGTYEQLPTGVILGTAQLTKTYRTEVIADCLFSSEKACGDFTPGRYAWRLSDINKYVKPIPARGLQRLWNWEERP